MIARCGPGTADGECAGRILSVADDAQWRLEGALTMGSARAVLDQAGALAPPVSGEVDCSALTAVDSVAVAVLLTLKRRASGAGLRFIAVPAPLRALADVYDVSDLLGIA